MAVAEFLFAVLEETDQGAVYVAEAQEAEVVGVNLRISSTVRFVARPEGETPSGQPAGRRRYLTSALRDCRPRKLLAHDGGVFGLYFVEHADFAGLAVGILVDAEIFLGHLVDVGAGAVFGDLDDAAADFEIAVGILGVH